MNEGIIVELENIKKGLEVVDKTTWALMNYQEKCLLMVGGTINVIGIILFLLLLNFGLWWIGLIICWIIGIPLIWRTRMKVIARVLKNSA